jgi:hypothetical protein
VIVLATKQGNVEQALVQVMNLAIAARNAPDLDAAKKALNEVWFAAHLAQEAIIDAEKATREAALQALERAA